MANKSKSDFVYLKVYEWIKEKIDSKSWHEGEQIPNEHDLVKELNVSRDTVRKALAMLLREGYIYRHAGKGTFIKHTKSNYRLATLESFTEQMLSRGLEPSSKMISVECIIPDKEVGEKLQLNNNDKVYKIVRLREADNEPMAYEISYIPEVLCSNLEEKLKYQSSLYKIYEEEYGHDMDFGNITLEAENCSSDISKVLEIDKNSPILKMKCVVYLKTQKPLYFVECYYIGEKYIFSLSIPRHIQ